MASQIREAGDSQPFQALDPRFLDSNYVPSDLEVGQLKAVLVEEEKELARHQEEMAVLRQKLGQLEASEQLLKANVEGRRSAVSMQRRVPVEIWERIFTILCTSLHDYSLDVDWDKREDYNKKRTVVKAPPMTLSCVCSRWKNMVHSCPRLWSSIRIDFLSPSDITRPLRTYLDRSKAYPLKFMFGFEEDEEGDFFKKLSPHKQRAWKLVLPHLKQCRELVLRLDEMSRFSAPTKVLTFPKLESFCHLNTINTNISSEGPSWFWNALRRAPRLRDVVVDGLLDQSIPYNQIKSLAIQRFTIWDAEKLLQLLPSCETLASLTLGPDGFVGYHGQEPPSLQNVVEVSSLRHLTITSYSIDNLFSIVWPLLRLPSLISFSFSCGILPSALSALLQRCSSTLEKVTIELGIDEQEKDSLDLILPLLQSLSCLTHLELTMTSGYRSGTVAPHIVQLFTILLARLTSEEGAEATTFLPKLQSIHLTFSDVGVTTELVERILEVITFRQVTSTASPLTYFRVSRPSHQPSEGKFVLDGDILEKIKGFRNEGIRVIFDDAS